jgi:hypothetical protein
VKFFHFRENVYSSKKELDVVDAVYVIEYNTKKD